MNKSITDKLKLEIETNYHNKLFTIKDFTHLGSYGTIKRLLIRFDEEKFINRVIDGIYTKPKYSKLTNEIVPVTAHDLALKIADNFSWKIIPTGNYALNILGLSNQVPVSYEYLSTGPYRDYKYNQSIIKFKNTKNSEISELNYKSSLIVTVLRTLGKNNVDKKIINKIREQLTFEERKMLLMDTKKVTSWIYEIIKEVCLSD